MEQTSGGPGEGQHDCNRCQPPADWLRQLAASLVTHTVLPEAAARAIEEVFLKAGVRELRLVLANGDSEALECFALVENSHVNRLPLLCGGALDTRGSSAAYESMRCCAVVEVTEQSPERHSYADWRELSSHHGTTWLLAAPLTCHDNCALNLVGAVLAAGTGPRPSISPAWLREWSCEAAKSLAHASVQLMETSLDMLHVIFPPQVLQQLLYNAVQSDAQQQQALAEATARAAAAAAFAAGAGGPARSAAPLPPPPPPLLHDGSRSSGSGSSARVYSPVLLGPARLCAGRGSGGSSQAAAHLDDTQTSPFAALASASGSEDLGLSPTSPRSPLLPEGASSSAELREGVQPVRLSAGSAGSGGGGHVGPSGPSGSGWIAGLVPLEHRSASMGSHCSLVRQASIASSAAAALLRQASLQSDTSFLFEDADSNPVGSPHGSEVAGFEDLLREDAARHAQRRSSRDASPPPPSPIQHDSAASTQWSTSARSSPSPQSPMHASSAAAAHGMSHGPVLSLLSQHLPGAGSPTSSPTSRGGLPLPPFRPAQRSAAAALQQATAAQMVAGAGGSSGGQAGGGSGPRGVLSRGPVAASGADAAAATTASRPPEHRAQAQAAVGSGAGSGSEWEEAATPFASVPSPMAAPAGVNAAALGAPGGNSGAGVLEAGARGSAGEREPTGPTTGTRLEAIKEASSSSLASELSSDRLSAALSAALSLAGSPSGPGPERLERVAEEAAGASSRATSAAGSPTHADAALGAAAKEAGSSGSALAKAAGKEREEGGSRAGDGAASNSSASFQDAVPAASTAGPQPPDAEPAAPARPVKPARLARPPSEPTDGQLAGASKPGAGGKLGAEGAAAAVSSSRSGAQGGSMPAQQWDLAFVDASLEGRYQRWSCRRGLAHDKLMGWTYAVVVLATLFALLCRRELTGELVALHAVGCALFLLPGVLASANEHFWVRNRNDLLAISRLFSMAIYAAYAYMDASHDVEDSSALLCAFCRTGVCCMLICALRQLLPFSVHLPVQLLCLWMGTATIGLMNGRGLGPGCRALSLPVALGAQVLLGFALPTALVWRHERRERRLFLNLHGRAAA